MITQEKLKKSLHYDSDTGLFVSLISTNKRPYGNARARECGQVVGTKTKEGYLVCYLFGKIYKLHRLAWLYEYGCWPNGDIDHMDGNKSNNKISNLRICDHRINAQNLKTGHKDGLSGYLGVTWNKKVNKWMAQITDNGKQKTIGFFDDKKSAHNAYIEVKKKLHEGFVS